MEENDTRFSGNVLARGDGTIVNEGIHDLAFCICKHLGNMSPKMYSNCVFRNSKKLLYLQHIESDFEIMQNYHSYCLHDIQYILCSLYLYQDPSKKMTDSAKSKIFYKFSSYGLS